MADQQTLTDHDKIKQWADKHDAKPSVVQTDDNDSSILRFDQGGDNDNLEHINWDHFFELFDDNKLALIVDDDSSFCKFVSRDNA